MGTLPDQVDNAVTARVPVYVSRDDRYFQDTYQGMPSQGYTRMIEKMLSHDNIKIMLQCDCKEIIRLEEDGLKIFDQPFSGTLIFTGKIDEFFQYSFGKLSYRSTKFDFQYIQEQMYQPVATVNYPNSYDFTRITEFRHMTGQNNTIGTTILREYPQSYDSDIAGRNVPMYPVLDKNNEIMYSKYKKLAEQYDNIIFLGRLAEYRYYDMDAVVGKALEVFRGIANSSVEVIS